MTIRILQGDCRDVLRTMEPESVHCVVTSPPYWGLRDYGLEPTIWGGDPSCAHQWGEPQRTANANSMPGPNGRGGKNGDGRRNETKWTGPFCGRCGAWRGTFGLEPSFDLYVKHSVEVFREVRRVLRLDGTLWLNLGDCYATGAGRVGSCPGGGEQGERWISAPSGIGHRGRHEAAHSGKHAPRIAAMGPVTQPNRMPQPGLKPKDLVGIPWRVAFALQADGWWLRQDIIWSKPNPMPESVTDRCTKAHEYIFMLTKSERYFFDQDAILEDASANTHARLSQDVLSQIGSDRAHAGGKTNGNMKAVARLGGGNRRHKGTEAYESGASEHRTKCGLVAYSDKQRKLAEAGSGIKNNDSMNAALAIMPIKRNRRSVWTVGTEPFSEAHFATFPPALIEPCILASCPTGGVVVDPFGGAGTTGLVADRLQRNAVLIELNPNYADMAERRLRSDGGMLCDVRIEHSANPPLMAAE